MPTWVATNKTPGGSGNGDLQNGSASNTDHYDVQFTDTTANQIDAILASGVPDYGAQLGSYNLWVLNKTAERDPKNGTIFHLTVEYKTIDYRRQPPKPSGWSSGDKYGTHVSVSGLPYEVELQSDLSSPPKCIQNTNAEPVTPPLKTLKYDILHRIHFWCDQIDITNIKACIGHCNSADVTTTVGASTVTWEAYRAFFQSWSADQNVDTSGAITYDVTYEFVYRPNEDTFQYTYVPNSSKNTLGVSGYSGYTGFSGLQKSNRNGVIGELVYLDSAGAIIPQGGNVHRMAFVTVPSASFTSLMTGIP